MIINEILVDKDSRIKSVLNIINKSVKQNHLWKMALVVDNKHRLIGAVTDGDVRRGLINGVTVNDRVSKIMVNDPIFVESNLSKNEMLLLMKKKIRNTARLKEDSVEFIIIVDDDHKPIDLVSFHDISNEQLITEKPVCIIGVGQVGLTLLVVIAETGFKALGYDINQTKIKKLCEGKVDFFELGVESLLKIHLKNENLKFVNKLKNDKSQIYIICVGTPVDESTNRPIIDDIKSASEIVSKSLNKNDLIILRSTVTVGTTRNTVIPIIEKNSGLKAGKDFSITFSPERVVEGNAIEEIKKIPQIIGGIDSNSVRQATRFFQKIGSPIIAVESLEAAEIVKLINNTFRDYCFGFSNNLVSLCDKLGLNTNNIISAASDGYPRNQLPKPSPGVGGYCLTKDPYLLAHVAEENDLASEIYTVGRRANQNVLNFVFNKFKNFSNEFFKGKKELKIFVMGIAFKGYPETSDTRGSTALDLIELLINSDKRDLKFYVFDSVVKKEKLENNYIKYQKYQDGFLMSDAVFIMNNHPSFSKINIFKYIEKMNKPSFFFDGWDLYSKKDIEMTRGVHYFNLGG